MYVISKKIVAGAVITAAITVLFIVLLPRRERIVAQPSATPSPSVSSTPFTTPEESPSASPTSVAPVNPLTGETCNNALRRPIAVMLSGDAITRPLSGIGEADMVFEMPVITGSITRFMAVYICRDPIEIGSVRSARDDFIPLAKGLDAIYAHWGGSHFALDLLKQHAIDNIDALVNPTGAYWRKETVAAPHNGFTSLIRLVKAARFLQYRLEGASPVYPHLAVESATSVAATTTRGSLEIGYPGEFRVHYEYNPQTHAYTRIRGGITERDRNIGDAVVIHNIVIMRAASHQIEGQYNDVAVVGSGDAAIYRNGQEILGVWQKDKKNPASKLMFVDTAGQEIPFAAGNIWVEIVEPYTDVQWHVE